MRHRSGCFSGLCGGSAAKHILACLLAMFLKRQPLHVAGHIRAAGAQGLNVINVIAPAATAGGAISRAGVTTLKLGFGFAAALFADA